MQRSTGFTLIEVLLYTVFVSVLMTSMVLLANTAFTVRSKVRASLILAENMRFAVGRITSLVGDASSVTSPAIGGTSSTMVLTMASSTTNPTTITKTGNIIYVTQGTGTALAITSSEVSVSSFSITRTSSTAPVVRIVITGGLTNAAASYPTLTVTTTAAVRR